MMKNKIFKYLGTLLTVTLFFNCQNLEQPEFSDFLYDGPIITLSNPSPTGTTVIRSADPIASITIDFQVEDDLGIASIMVKIDGDEILNMNEFPDNKFVDIDDLTYNNLTTGSHTLTIIATDTNDVTVTQTTNFEKIDALPYMPLYAGETFYMAFNGDYTESVSGNSAAVIGSPSFTTDARVGSEAYMGATNAYLTFPTTGLLENEFSAAFWYKLNNTDTNRAGILVVGPEDTGNAGYPDVQNKRSNGFRFFREGGDAQSFRLNVGNGTNDGTVIPDASLNLSNGSGWVHFAFSISQTKTILYINGTLAKELDRTVDWTGCDLLSIMSGAPRFTGWNHKSDLSTMDELRLFNKAITQTEVTKLVADGSKIFNMPFDDSFIETISDTDATIVGNPSFTADAKKGSGAYVGATDAYLTFPTAGLLENEFSAAFWYKLNNTDTNRAGILVVGPEDTGNAGYPDVQNKRSNGFRFFREGGDAQSFRLNVGNGTNDGTVIPDASLNLSNGSGWVHFAFTISQTKSTLYINGELAKELDRTVDWTGCNILSIMSGAPRFTGWNHKSDLSTMDELTLYNKALSLAEIQAIMNN